MKWLPLLLNVVVLFMVVLEDDGVHCVEDIGRNPALFNFGIFAYFSDEVDHSVMGSQSKLVGSDDLDIDVVGEFEFLSNGVFVHNDG